MFRTAFVLSAIALAILPAAASADATCSLAFDVEIEGGGVYQQGPGTARCVGTIDGFMVDPDAGTAFVRATADHGTCGIALRTGSLRMHLRRIAFFDDPKLELAGTWSTAAAVAGGLLSTGRVDMDLLGTARMIPRDESCTAGRLQIDLRTSGERPAPPVAATPAQSAPAAETRAAAPKQAKKSKKKSRACSKKKGKKRASKRCRRARRA